MDNEIIELHPPLVTFASIDYDGDPPPVQNPPPPAPYDHKSRDPNPNLVVVNRNDLESILVSKGGTAAAQAAAQQAAAANAAAAAAAQAAQSAQNYRQPIQPRGQHHRVSKKNIRQIIFYMEWFIDNFKLSVYLFEISIYYFT